MNKNDLVAAVADNAGLTKADASKAVDGVFDAITDALSRAGKSASLASEPSLSRAVRQQRAAIRAPAKPSTSRRPSSRNSRPVKA